jgi:predicted ATP-binding protein involved in virulence
MMRLVKCEFDGVNGFSKFDLTDLKDVTALTGPNGSGKSSILQILKLAFHILGQKTVCDKLEQPDSWYKFQKAALYFTDLESKNLQHFDGHLGQSIRNVVVEIELINQQFEIRRVSNGSQSVYFTPKQITKQFLSQLETTANSIQNSITEKEKAVT